MTNWHTFLLLFFILLLFPTVMGEGYKQVRILDFPTCYGDITFSIVGASPYAADAIQLEGCSSTKSCACTGVPQSINFSVLDNISNSFEIMSEFYIAPLVEYTGDTNLVYNPNEDNKRNLQFMNIKVSPASGVKVVGTSFGTTTVFIIILVILIIIGGGLFFLVKLFKDEDKGKGGDKKNVLVVKKKTVVEENNTDDIQKYLKKLNGGEYDGNKN